MKNVNTFVARIPHNAGVLNTLNRKTFNFMHRTFLMTAAAALVPLAFFAPKAHAASCVKSTITDWMVSGDALAAPLRPADCAAVEQSPPEFTWPSQGSGARYEVVVTYPTGEAVLKSSNTNWTTWDQVLPAGEYTWQVRLIGNTNKTSISRRFTVGPNARNFVLPDANTLLARVQKITRPRTFDLNGTSLLAAFAAERKSGLNQLLQEVQGKLGNPVQPEPTSTSKNQIYDEAVSETKRTLNSTFAWLATRDSRYYADAIRRTKNLVAWNPNGKTSHASQDMANRTVAWTLVLVYDWMYSSLTPSERQQMLASIQPRVAAMYNDVIGSNVRVSVNPYDSHGNQTLTILAASATLLAGDVPEAAIWMRDALPPAVVWTSPWGWQDGGFGNGTYQATWDIGGLLIPWYVLRSAVGIDVAQKGWVNNYGRYLAYFLPPGSPSGMFGDGAEDKLTEAWARFGKAYAQFAPTPLGRWYAQNQSGEDQSRLESLLAPRADLTPAVLPAGTPNAAMFESIGWAAMHSNLADAGRTSIYFKSSPYGSYNHSHGDQNSFVIVAAGKRLAIDSGYYDDYKTPHWNYWYKQTIAHNAITFDGGQGQVHNERSASGNITRFENTATYDLVTGDAKTAYGNALSKAERTMVYLRPNIVLVYDFLGSATARQWEWNIHALNQMTVSGNTLILDNQGTKVCVKMLSGPASRFSQTDKFLAAPQGNRANQWHGQFATETKSTSAEFIFMMDVGCTQNNVVFTPAKNATSSSTVKIGNTTVSSLNGIVTHSDANKTALVVSPFK